MDKLSVAFGISLVGGALGLIAVFVTQASLAEAFAVAITLMLLAIYILWKIEFKSTYEFRTGLPEPQNSINTEDQKSAH
jgi:hypothetical protein